tara:strand:+ start:824 stop:1270 length:447 start_codon:yes stop_codon:yes gene_type:complete
MMQDDDDMSFFLDNYKNNYVAQHLNDTPDNKALLENAKKKINSLLNNLTIENQTLISKNKQNRNQIENINNEIEKAKKQHKYLEKESGMLLYSDLGAIEQNKNTYGVYQQYRRQIFFKLALLTTILIFLYINGNIVQTIRNKIPTNIK